MIYECSVQKEVAFIGNSKFECVYFVDRFFRVIRIFVVFVYICVFELLARELVAALSPCGQYMSI